MKPETLYLIKVVPGGNPLKYRDLGGGKFTKWDAVLGRAEALRQKGVHYKVYEGTIEWEELDDPYS